MSPAPDDRTESLFAAAAALPPADRAGFLDRHCGDDPMLRRHLEALLRAHDRPAHLLDRPATAGLDPTGAYSPDDGPGTVIAGRYKLLEAIGEGGMGTVWAAEQIQPVKRKVALKLIKPGMDSRAVLARFEAERQALALMDHPNIARVLDAGLTDAGRPFFVMEYVKGVPITEYCDAARLTVQDRLALFIPVCQAVQHAHQKAIIHRDLKPSNILVAPYDDRPVPKVIDFGLAKALNQSLTERTLHTSHGAVLGTPLYMSPEQAQLNNVDVDTRSDVYSLGVLLYELLTGETPLEKQRFREAAWDEVRRIICEEEPPRPSVRLSGSKVSPAPAVGRDTRPPVPTRLVRDELDWIVMKALDKNRARRYETANGLARDVQRFLDGDPVEARPPTVGYRLKKAIRKHRTAVTLALAILACLAASTVVSGLFAYRAEAARRSAVAQAEATRRALERAEAAEARLQEEAANAQKVLGFVFGLFEDMAPPRPSGKPLDLLSALDRAAEQAGRRDTHPLARATMHELLAFGYLLYPNKARVRDHWQQAYQLRRDTLGEDHNDTLNTMQPLAQMLELTGRRGEAQALMARLAELSRRKFGPGDDITTTAIRNLALMLEREGKYAEAAVHFAEAAESERRAKGHLGPASVHALRSLADCQEAQGRYDLMEAPLTQALEDLDRWENFGNVTRDSHTAPVRIQLAGALVGLGRLDDAETLLRGVLALPADTLDQPADRPRALSLLGRVLLTRKNYTEAGPLLLQGYAGMKTWTPSGHLAKLRLAAALQGLIDLYEATGQKDEAARRRKELEVLKAKKE